MSDLHEWSSWNDGQIYDLEDINYISYLKEKETKRRIMSNVVGKVEVIAPNKVGFYNVKIGNDWYGTGSKNMPTFTRGQTIEFNVEETVKDGRTFKNMKDVKTVTSAPQTETTRPTFVQTTAVKAAPAVDWDLKDRKIQQQSARNAAISWITLLAAQGAIAYKASAKEKDKVVVLEALLEHYTDQFLNATGNVGAAPVATQADDLAGEEV